LRANSGHVWLRVRGVAQFNSAGIAIRLVGSIVDVTERREAELKLIDANIRVMEAARAKEAFLATMSHEIRTPMNGVLGIAGLLADTQLNDEQRDYIRLIRASGDTLLRLINDVLDFSKIESGHMTLESVNIELVSVIEDAFELVAENAREKKLILVYDSPEDIPEYILGDATRLRQILLNLLSNAIKFTDAGEIALSVSCKTLADSQLELTIKISDTGIGIPAERIQQLFQPFTQVDASTTRKYGGTGLGLAIVKRLVTMMGGTVSLESVEGKGSVCSFSIITKRASGPQQGYMQRNVSAFSGKQLLLVDSNPRRCNTLKNCYQRWGFDVLVCTHTHADAQMQSATSSGHPVDILVTDALLPSPEFDAMQTALESDDNRRLAAGARKLIVVLMSVISRAALAQVPPFKLIHHDMLVVQPVSRTRMFDVLTQAATGRSKNDVATRPFTRESTHDVEYAVQNSATGPKTPITGRTSRSNMTSDQVVDSDSATLNVLVAEDNEVNQRVIDGMLRRLGHRVTIVPDGQAAIDAMLSQKQKNEIPYDVVLMDIHMPVLDGVAAMKAIKQLFCHTDIALRMPAIPIAAMTAHALAGDREHYLNEGMDDYISKPMRSEELSALLLRAVPHKRLTDFQSRPLSAGSKMQQQEVGDKSSGHMLPTIPVTAAKAGTPAADVKTSPDLALPILDIEQLEDLIGLPAGADDIAGSGANGLIELFKTKARERLLIIRSCLVDSNWVLLGDTAHSLRGAAASIGFPRVAAACKTLELASRRLAPVAGLPPAVSISPMPTPGQLDELHKEITLHFNEAEEALAKWLALQP
ncbi:MAG: ATP-binding protein, partial [Pseudomonadota bacterium]